jgi:hypothetical protein
MRNCDWLPYTRMFRRVYPIKARAPIITLDARAFREAAQPCTVLIEPRLAVLTMVISFPQHQPPCKTAQRLKLLEPFLSAAPESSLPENPIHTPPAV